MLETVQVDHGSVAGALRALPGKPLTIFLFCLAIWSLTNMDQSLFGYALPGILADLHISLGVASIILSIGFGFTIVAVVVIGLATDRFGRRSRSLAASVCQACSSGFRGSPSPPLC